MTHEACSLKVFQAYSQSTSPWSSGHPRGNPSIYAQNIARHITLEQHPENRMLAVILVQSEETSERRQAGQLSKCCQPRHVRFHLYIVEGGSAGNVFYKQQLLLHRLVKLPMSH